MRVAALGPMVVTVVLGASVACKDRHGLGHECVDSGDCESGLVCRRLRCALADEATRQLLSQSGAIDDTAERPVVGGQPVKVRTASADDHAFAACRPDERLLGGGCSGGHEGEDTRHLRSWPDGFTEDDTLGARWYCLGTGRVNAFALCQQPAPPVAVDAAVAPTP